MSTGEAMNDLRAHAKPKRELEARIQTISFNNFEEPGFDGENETPLIEWIRSGQVLVRYERATIDGYYVDNDSPRRTRKTTMRKALQEAIPLWPQLWIRGLSNQELIRLFTHRDYFELISARADDEDGYVVNNSIYFFSESDALQWEEGDDYMERHLDKFPSKSPGGFWLRDECDDCQCTGVDPLTEKDCHSCKETGFI